MVRKSFALSIGLPHSGHSGGVSGSVSSSMVLSTSTNGTSATMPANSSPARLAIAPRGDLLALAQAPCARRHVIIVDFRRRRHRRIGEPQVRRLEFVATHGAE